MKTTNSITAKGWLRYHPYNKQVTTDFYYLKLCNKVLNVMKNKKFDSIFSSLDEKTELAYILTAYFEDTISETRIFSSFTEQHYKLYGKYLPFYSINPKDYYPDEVNLQDISFLIWHFQTTFTDYDLGIISDPLHPEVIELSEVIYDLFDKEFENAPQNEDLQNFITDINADSPVLEIRKRIEFIACDCYLNALEFSIFMQDQIDELKKKTHNKRDKDDFEFYNEHAPLILYDAKLTYVFNETSPLLSLYAKEILCNMLGKEHPAYQLIQKISTKKNSLFLYKKEEETFYIFKHIYSSKTIHLSKESCSFKKESLIPDQSVYSLNMTQWGDLWQLTGSSVQYDIPMEELLMTSTGIGIFNEIEDQLKIINEQEIAFLSVNNNKYITYLSSQEELKNLMIEVNITQFKKSHPHLSNEKMKEYAEINFNTLILDDFKNIVIFYNPLGGTEFYPDFADFINDKDNSFYDESVKIDLEEVLFDKTFSKEFINYLTENSLINFPIHSEFKNGNEQELIFNNLDFLLRYYKRNHYWTKPQITIMDK